MNSQFLYIVSLSEREWKPPCSLCQCILLHMLPAMGSTCSTREQERLVISIKRVISLATDREPKECKILFSFYSASTHRCLGESFPRMGFVSYRILRGCASGLDIPNALESLSFRKHISAHSSDTNKHKNRSYSLSSEEEDSRLFGLFSH